MQKCSYILRILFIEIYSCVGRGVGKCSMLVGGWVVAMRSVQFLHSGGTRGTWGIPLVGGSDRPLAPPPPHQKQQKENKMQK